MSNKHLVRLFALLAVLGLVLTACAPAATPERIVETVEVRVVETVEVPVKEEFPTGEITAIAPVDTPGFFPSQARKFEELHPGVKINFIESGWEPLHMKLTTDMVSGVYTYDVMFNVVRDLSQFADAGWLQEIDLAAHGLDKGITALYLSEYKGKYWSVPYTAYPQVFAYNEEMLAKVGMEPPKTWDDVRAILRALKDQGVLEYPWVLPLKEGRYGPRTVEQFCMFFGGVIADDEGNTLMDSPECRAGIEYLVSIYQEGLIDPASLVADDFERDSAFAQGLYVFSVASTWGFTQAVKNPDMSSVMGKVHLVPTSQHEGKGNCYVSGLTMMIPTTAKNVPLAMEFMKYMVTYGGGLDNLLQTGNLTTVEAVVTDPRALKDVEGLEIMMQEVVNGKTPPKTPWYPDWYIFVSPLITPLVKGELSVDDFIAQNVEWMEQQK